MKKHKTMVAVLMLGAVLIFAGCGQGKMAPGTPGGAEGGGAQAAGTAAVQSGQPGSSAANTAVSGQVTTKADVQAVNQQVQTELNGLDQDLQALGQDTPVDPDQAASGF